MKICIPKEVHAGERRVPMTPDNVAKLAKRGARIEIEAGMGLASGHADAAYTVAGATVAPDRQALLSSADLLLRLRKPAPEEIAALKPGCIHVSYLDPFNDAELVR
jgi:NAD(P) transhydrogenase subunit alpha